VAVQEVILDEGGSQSAEDYIFLYGNGNVYHHLRTGILHKRIISAVKRVKFINDRILYIVLGGH